MTRRTTPVERPSWLSDIIAAAIGFGATTIVLLAWPEGRSLPDTASEDTIVASASGSADPG